MHVDIQVNFFAWSQPELVYSYSCKSKSLCGTVLPELEFSLSRVCIDGGSVRLLAVQQGIDIEIHFLCQFFPVARKMDVHHGLAHFEQGSGKGRRYGLVRTDDFGRDVRRYGGFRFSRQVDTEQFETVVAVRFDEVERACVAGEGLKAQSEGGFSRFGHPEKRIGFNALRAFQSIFLAVGLQVRFGTDFYPVVRAEVGVRIKHRSRVAQFHFRNVEGHGVG